MSLTDIVFECGSNRRVRRMGLLLLVVALVSVAADPASACNQVGSNTCQTIVPM